MNCRLPLVFLASLFGAACSSDLTVVAEPTSVQFVYSPATGQVPLPNDILFSGSLDATLNLPPAAVMAQQPLFDSLNSLDGWSTSAPGSFAFASGVDPATVTAGTTVRLFEVTLAVSGTTGLTLGQSVTDVLTQLSAGTDYVVAPAASDPSNATYAVVPLKPFSPKKSYMLVVTNGILGTDGQPVRPSDTYLIASADVITNPLQSNHPLAGLQVLINAMENVASTDTDVTPAIVKDDIVCTLTFTTQSLFEGLAAVQAVAAGGEAVVLASMCAGSPSNQHLACFAAPANQVPTGALLGLLGDTSVLLMGATGHADVYAASLTLPYYLTAAANPAGGVVSDPAPLTERWTARFSFLEGTGAFDPMETDKHVTQHNPLPLQTAAETVPVLISLPNAMSGNVQPGTGWPVVIFQHGITADRSSMIAIADSLADAGFACVAIDLPLHGVVVAAGLHVGTQDGMLRERSFGLDLVTQDGSGNVTAATPDGTADTSGAHFINLTSLQTQRDNLRQSVADLFGVVKLITDNMDVDSSTAIVGPDFDPAQIHFVGMSLGAIVGTPFVALDAAAMTPVIKSATLNVPGGGIPRMLEASPTFGPIVVGGLAAAGVVQGTPEFDSFMVVAQTTVDSGDPINFSPSLAGGALPIFVQEVVGGGAGGGLTDQVVPNYVSGAPLSGTDPMIAELGLTVLTATTATNAGAVGFSEGTHSSLLDPNPDMDADAENLAAFIEMQTQVASWLASIAGAPTVTITDGTVIAP
ncbi:MAG: hypothetical protein ACI9F9_001480 [Candidatus Paceibacteria bacterium]|jgi:hypothetical protein